MFGAPSPVSFVSNVPNTLGTPFNFRATGEDVAGAVDIYYSTGSFELGPDDALVIEGTIPPSRFTNVMLWNVHMQTMEYRTHTTSLNHEQIVPEPDGTYRIVVSERDPGVPQLARHVRAPARLDLLALPAAGGGAGHAPLFGGAGRLAARLNAGPYPLRGTEERT